MLAASLVDVVVAVNRAMWSSSRLPPQSAPLDQRLLVSRLLLCYADCAMLLFQSCTHCNGVIAGNAMPGVPVCNTLCLVPAELKVDDLVRLSCSGHDETDPRFSFSLW